MSAQRPKPLTDQEISDGLLVLPGWHLAGREIVKSFEFPTYNDGILFVCAAAREAEAMDHHPTLTVGWCKVTAALSTHDPAGITVLDMHLAERLDELAAVKRK